MNSSYCSVKNNTGNDRQPLLKKHSTLQFTRINHRPLVAITVCINSCEINTVNLTYGWSQVPPWNNDSTIKKKKEWLQLLSSNNRLFLTIYIPVTTEFSLLVTMISPCCNSCSANTEYIWNNAWLQRLFYNGKKPFIEWNPLNQRVLKKWWLQVSACFKETQ